MTDRRKNSGFGKRAPHFVFFRKSAGRASLWAALFLAFFSGDLRASSETGTTAANFLKIPVAVIPSAMGEAYTAMVGPDSILYNPAGLGLLSYPSFSGSHNQYLEGITQEYAALTYRSKYGTFGFGFSMLTSGEITAYDGNDMNIGHTSTNHRFVMLSYAQSWPHFDADIGKLDPMLITPSWTRVEPVIDYRPKAYRIALGASIKQVGEKLADQKSTAYSFDAGALAVLPAHVQIGVSVLNFSGRQKFADETYDLPRVLRAGIAKDFHTINDIMIFKTAADVVKYSDYGFFGCIGFETDVMRVFQLRIGYKTQRDTGSRISGGFGMNFDSFTEKENIIHGVRVDYAYLDYGNLGATHRLGLQLIW
ncbi:MAG: hypothetical protein KKH28_02230 [Elusimicrobia bacterium]|nr:hypothetical protein [Elusimicrobiota bacterium]